jgi:hypothetical protein
MGRDCRWCGSLWRASCEHASQGHCCRELWFSWGLAHMGRPVVCVDVAGVGLVNVSVVDIPPKDEGIVGVDLVDVALLGASLMSVAFIDVPLTSVALVGVSL